MLKAVKRYDGITVKLFKQLRVCVQFAVVNGYGLLVRIVNRTVAKL